MNIVKYELVLLFARDT